MTDEVTIESLQAQIKKDAKIYEKTLNSITALTEELDKYKAKHVAQEKHLKKQERLAREAREAEAKESGDLDAINKSWQEKYDALKSDYSAYKNTSIKKDINAQARQIAEHISVEGRAHFIERDIADRLYADNESGQIRVNGTDGKPSASTLKELETEFSENKAYEMVIKGSSANGGGPAGGNGSNGAAKSLSRTSLDKMNPLQVAEHFRHGGVATD